MKIEFCLDLRCTSENGPRNQFVFIIIHLVSQSSGIHWCYQYSWTPSSQANSLQVSNVQSFDCSRKEPLGTLPNRRFCVLNFSTLVLSALIGWIILSSQSERSKTALHKITREPWLWETARVQQVVGSNTNTGY